MVYKSHTWIPDTSHDTYSSFSYLSQATRYIPPPVSLEGVEQRVPFKTAAMASVSCALIVLIAAITGVKSSMKLSSYF